MTRVRRIVLTGGLVLASLLVLILIVVLPLAASYLITSSRFHYNEKGPHEPAAVGLSVESVAFASSDGVALKGWWNPGNDKAPVVIFCHGLNRSRLELLERAAETSRRGFAVLLFDFRNHGESGKADTTLGIKEARDVCAASALARRKAPNRPQLLWGVSMGAATALLSVRDCGGFAGVVSDSSFPSLRETVAHHLQLYFHLPAFPIANLIVAVTGMRAGIDPDQGDVERAIRSFGPVPVLFIAGTADRRMPPDVAQRLFGAATSPLKQLLVVPGAGHGEAFSTDRRAYLDAVFGFFDAVGAAEKQSGFSER